MKDKYQQLISTLNKLFQTDQEDLDFGIYRIMNQKRGEINSFLENDLKKTVTEGLSQLEKTDTEALAQELEKTVHSLNEAGVDPDTAPKVIELKKQINASNTTADAENEIYSHLVDFFSRYYQEGDFISQRRYKDDVYAIPYQGEEVKLYWANHDQYYIKTTENFSNYSFKLENSKTVTFRLVEASTEQNNNKTSSTEERKFKLAEESFIKEIEDELVIYFEYLPVGKKPSQDQLIEEAVVKLLDKVPEDFRELTKTVPTKKNPDRTVLKKKLKEYTSKNTFDYFIHKDLKGFLQRELDFYIKNELLNINDLDTAVEHNKDIYAKIKVFKSISSKVIDFLAQIENFQKKLWEKKKFITESEYLITLNHVQEKYFPIISKNDLQIKQWIEYGFISKDDNVDISLLKKRIYLPLDTKYFPQIKDDLIAGIEKLDESTDGLLLNSENWQALNLLKESYRNSLNCVYIDPPFNLGDNKDFPYKTNYLDSSWLALLMDRILISREFLDKRAGYFLRCDYHGNHLARLLLNKIFGSNNFKNEIVINRFKRQLRNLNKFNYSVESLFLYSESEEELQFIEQLKNRTCTFCNQEIEGAWRGMSSPGLRRPPERVIFGRKLLPPKGRHWTFTQERIEELVKENRIRINENATYVDLEGNRIQGLPEYQQSPDVPIDDNWTDLKGYAFGSDFSTENAEELLERVLNTTTKECDIVMDFFMGSGTTQAVAHKMNRKWIGVEMGKYFKRHPFSRINKVLYGDTTGISSKYNFNGGGIVKYLKLESYEDALNNVVLSRSKKQQSLLDSNSELQEDYFLHYMFDVETRDSQSLLNIDELSNPFNYSLLLTTENEQRRQSVDVAETFNYLLGLHVNKRYKKENCLIYEGKQHQTNKNIAVIWRNTNEVGDEELQNLVDFLCPNTDIVYVNGQTTVSSKDCEVLTLEPEFKKRMFN